MLPTNQGLAVGGGLEERLCAIFDVLTTRRVGLQVARVCPSEQNAAKTCHGPRTCRSGRYAPSLEHRLQSVLVHNRSPMMAPQDHKLQLADRADDPLVANFRVGDRRVGEMELVGEDARQHLFLHRPTDALQAGFEVDLVLPDDLMRHPRLVPLTEQLIQETCATPTWHRCRRKRLP